MAPETVLFLFLILNDERAEKIYRHAVGRTSCTWAIHISRNNFRKNTGIVNLVTFIDVG
jgi:hypothetical protein